MQYALLLYGKPGAFEALPTEQQQKIVAEFEEVYSSWPGIVSGTRLKPGEHATTVRMEDGQVLVTDGPFADTKEVLGGVIVVEADNLDSALELAKKLPITRFGGSIEVRPVMQVRQAVRQA
jgi:hypothetical protein